MIRLLYYFHDMTELARDFVCFISWFWKIIFIPQIPSLVWRNLFRGCVRIRFCCFSFSGLDRPHLNQVWTLFGNHYYHFIKFRSIRQITRTLFSHTYSILIFIPSTKSKTLKFQKNLKSIFSVFILIAWINHISIFSIL